MLEKIWYPPNGFDNINKIVDIVNKVRVGKKEDRLKQAKNQSGIKSLYEKYQAKKKLKKTIKKTKTDEDRTQISNLLSRLDKTAKAYYLYYMQNIHILEEIRDLLEHFLNRSAKHKQDKQYDFNEDTETFIKNTGAAHEVLYGEIMRAIAGFCTIIESFSDVNKLKHYATRATFKNRGLKYCIEESMIHISKTWANIIFPNIKKLKIWYQQVQKLKKQT